ncbi:putative RNA-directed DNA polymerase, partial [Operophtera brumata]
VSEIKYLGIIVDHRLNWKSQIRVLTRRVRKLIYIFKTLRNVCDPNQMISIYFALSISPSIVIYCITSWGSCAKSNLLQIERAQRAVLKVMSFKPFRFPTRQLYDEMSVLSVRKCFIKCLILQQHRKPFLPDLGQRRNHITYILCLVAELLSHIDFQAS